jgi:hypothetical protein
MVKRHLRKLELTLNWEVRKDKSWFVWNCKQIIVKKYVLHFSHATAVSIQPQLKYYTYTADVNLNVRN